MYELSTFSTESAESLEPGTTVLVTAPAMTGKADLVYEVLADGLAGGDGVLCVSPNASARSVTDALGRHEPSFDRGRVGVVDCSGSDPSRAPDGVTTEFVGSPSDLTGISIGTVKALDAVSDGGTSSVRYGVLSVSTLLHYLDLRTVFKFLHIYTARIGDTGGLGVFTLDSSAHDSETVATLSSEFDAVVELRSADDGGREFRLGGLPGSSYTWRRL